MQASLVARGRRGLHRTLGKVGAALGVAAIVANLTVLPGVAPRLRVVFLEEKLDPTFVTRAIWGDFGSTLAFAVFLGAGLWFRNRADVHGRSMLLASVSLIGPALGRIVLWPALAGVDAIKLLPYGGLAFFLASLWLYDLLSIGRVHPATLLGSTFRVLITIAAGAIAASDFGQRVVRGMAGL